MEAEKPRVDAWSWTRPLSQSKAIVSPRKPLARAASTLSRLFDPVNVILMFFSTIPEKSMLLLRSSR
jgi:hypothetical protein